MSLPTLYEYYAGGGISAGLSADQTYFTLNNRNITLYSGAMHYFRVPQEYWRDRLRKMRAAGLNTVETYVPWNLHEPEVGVYDFGDGGTDFQELLDIETFLKMAQEEDMFAIVRPGPYICSEWEFGGMPSWLLREKDIQVRSTDAVFMGHVERYLRVLFALLTALQFTMGGPIIAFQIENEYAYSQFGEFTDPNYLPALRDLFLDCGVNELMFTCDTPILGTAGSIPGILYTANFQNAPEFQLNALKNIQPDKPLMVMEFWTGWFDHWTEKHHTRTVEDFAQVLQGILNYPSSVNFYMFHGGTSFGFMNGGNIASLETVDNADFQPDTTSYDYDAPLTEAGDYTDKYHRLKEIIANHTQVQVQTPEMPAQTPRVAYPPVQITEYMDLDTMLNNLERVQSPQLVSMENLPINNNNGQQYGYIIYRKQGMSIPAGSVLKLTGRVCDSLMVLINGELKSKMLEAEEDLDGFGYWRQKDAELSLGQQSYENATLELVVENWGRVNAGTLAQYDQRKGLWQGPVSLNGAELNDWDIYPLEFKKRWTTGLIAWQPYDSANPKQGPAMYRGVLTVDSVNDTFVDMRQWKKGVVIVNGFVLSRYLRIGPQQTAYLPAPFLEVGNNDVIFFEHFVPSEQIQFSSEAVFETLE